jgi:carbamoyl-phosphate synthase large subunit
LIRRISIETGVNCFTSIDTVNALLTSLESNVKDNLTLIDIATVSTR